MEIHKVVLNRAKPWYMVPIGGTSHNPSTALSLCAHFLADNPEPTIAAGAVKLECNIKHEKTGHSTRSNSQSRMSASNLCTATGQTEVTLVPPSTFGTIRPQVGKTRGLGDAHRTRLKYLQCSKLC